MVRFIDIAPHHPLGRFHTFSQVKFHAAVGRSVENLFWHVALLQQGEKQLAQETLTGPRFEYNPENIQPHVFGQVQNWKPDLILQAPAIYEDILTYQLTLGHSPWLDAFKDTIGERKNGEILRFIALSSGNENVYASTNARNKRNGLYTRNDWVDGFNLYGLILTRVALKMFLGERNYRHGDHGLSLLNGRVYEEKSYKKTVLLLSDSNAGCVANIQHGEVLAVSGGTYGDMVDVLRESALKLSDFRYVIVNCGINDVQKPWLRNNVAKMHPLRDILVQEARERDDPSIVFSTAFPHPVLRDEWECARSHVQQLERAFEGTAVEVVNWFRESTPFLNDRDEMDWQYFEYSDGFHLSHHGFRVMWIVWSYYLEDLRKVPYTMAPKRGTIQPPRKRAHSKPSGFSPAPSGDQECEPGPSVSSTVHRVKRARVNFGNNRR